MFKHSSLWSKVQEYQIQVTCVGGVSNFCRCGWCILFVTLFQDVVVDFDRASSHREGMHIQCKWNPVLGAKLRNEIARNHSFSAGKLTPWTFRHDTSKMCNSQLYLFLDFGKLFSFLSCCDMSDMSDMLSPIFHLFSPMFHLFSPIFHLFSPIFHLFSRNFHLFSPIFHLFSPIFHLFSPNFHLFHVFHAYFHVDFPHFWFGSCQGSPSSGPLAEAAARSCLTVATHGEVPKVASCFWRTQKWRGDFQEIFKKIQRCSKI